MDICYKPYVYYDRVVFCVHVYFYFLNDEGYQGAAFVIASCGLVWTQDLTHSQFRRCVFNTHLVLWFNSIELPANFLT